MATVKLNNINKVYDGNVHAVVDFNLAILADNIITNNNSTTTIKIYVPPENILYNIFSLIDTV